jgi:ATP-dependent DNA helicase RecG
MLTNAAFLLFAKEETVLTTIELGRFQTDIIIKDSSRTKSDIISQIEIVSEFVKKHINKEVVITGQPGNIQKWQYPLEAVREIITNMVVHRDYRSSSDSIVKIYDNKIEFYNPGRLPETISVEDLISNNYKSTPRNKLIADFFKSIGFIEKYGSGIRRVLEYFADAGLPAPEFKNISDGFMVTIYSGDKLGDKLGDKQLMILKYIDNNPYISLSQLSRAIKISQTAVENNIKKLKQKGILKRVGPAKGGHWEVIDK